MQQIECADARDRGKLVAERLRLDISARGVHLSAFEGAADPRKQEAIEAYARREPTLRSR